ncbi:hypothetical protein [Allorhodopirellula solitaria]|uniref:Uncharacterized protein n=1 Tax=Allorhodopirellula solitaria TaxID=2527987 RepID=A0A5C5X097_9BACT|nr:hypothetical protein [Allorhodopirellula solitaria]TWT56230.1 hypothetical protein CA85_44120 [Allorhodopirellula solitaria]
MTHERSVQSLSSDTTLDAFLSHAVAANRAEQKTLALVMPASLALTPAFFCDLGSRWCELREKLTLAPNTLLRVDFCTDTAGMNWIPSIGARFEQWRRQRALSQRNLHAAISLTHCLLIGRPARDAATVVMGIADPSLDLPDWVKAAPVSLPRHSMC